MADTLDLMRARRVAMSEAAICDRNKAMEQILRWCDRQGEEPEGQCLHEIEQICRKQLGFELLKTSEPLQHERFKAALEAVLVPTNFISLEAARDYISEVLEVGIYAVASRELTPAEHTEERIKNATEGAIDAYDE